MYGKRKKSSFYTRETRLNEFFGILIECKMTCNPYIKGYIHFDVM